VEDGNRTLSQLRLIFTNINDWLRFAENKNGALVGADLAILFGFTIKGFIENYVPGVPEWALSISLMLLVFSLLLALGSFLPIRNPVFGTPKRSKFCNVLFFGDLCKLEDRELLGLVAEAVGENKDTYSGIETTYARQIIVNARIAQRKYTWFVVALCATVLGVLLPVVCRIVVYLHGG
jgi:hypothetical protein